MATREQPTTTRQIPPETSTAEQVATITEKLPSTETGTLATATTLRETTELMTTITEEEVELDSTTTEEQTEATTRNPGWISSPERRPNGSEQTEATESRVWRTRRRSCTPVSITR